MKHYEDPQDTVLRAALIPYAAISVISLIAWGVTKGGHALLGVVIAMAIVGVFFGSGFYIEKRVREVHPMAAMSAAMGSFAVKFMALGGFLVGFRNSNAFDVNAFAVTAIALAIGWLGGEVRAFTKARFFYVQTPAETGANRSRND